jgi:hypothetical protein
MVNKLNIFMVVILKIFVRLHSFRRFQLPSRRADFAKSLALIMPSWVVSQRNCQARQCIEPRLGLDDDRGFGFGQDLGHFQSLGIATISRPACERRSRSTARKGGLPEPGPESSGQGNMPLIYMEETEASRSRNAPHPPHILRKQQAFPARFAPTLNPKAYFDGT